MPRQAVILAAGTGSRLRPLTDTSPKCLLTIGKETILDCLLRHLAQGGVLSAVIVVGYLAEKIGAHLEAHPPPLDVKLVENPAYATTNNAASLFVTQNALREEGFLLCDGDVLLRGEPIRRLREEPEACALLVDSTVSLGAEEMKVITSPSGRVLLLSKELDPARCQGESIGVQKVGGPAVGLLWEELGRMMREGRENAYYEEAFQHLIDKGVAFQSVPVDGESWMEIDDLADLENARARFATS